MGRKNSNVTRRAWNLLRIALLWARKGGVFKRRLMMELRVLPKFIKNLCHDSNASSLHYGERQLSFDDTPIFHVKMHRPPSLRFNIPCITPQVDFDYDFEDQDGWCDGRKSFLKAKEDNDEEEEDCEYDQDSGETAPVVPEEEKGIDLKAEEFIAKFYEQMKLQRQISYLQYNEMLNRGTG